MNLRNLTLPRRIVAVGAALMLALSLSACAPTSPDFDPDAAALLQSSVADVTDAAAAGDPVAALAALDVLQEQLNENTATGAVGAEQSARIQASLDLVRADLTAALPDPSPVTDPVDEESDETSNGNGNSNGNSNGNGKDDDKEKDDKGNKKD
ncbi:hypothetical protein I6E68_04135 [Salinibacterium sp. NSLL150]|uniref:hypothetical protein n=1 Tax=unclassified Salinibacterium TaxID=2632331 RepID=UPI0018CFB19C|nr:MULTISPECIES: hypothetical protein [unclassified Salinibacterium]MBH0098329.1 hypothetical protein [Salinibacterium sp. NSLL35]MBH0101084.1 hypothetical protein [Salinibacterium sp. NSLL150]MBH0103843.1 hypothetical protein [Salinibacterium sp. NSLL16]MBH0106604.1 hypothetical protein [Salinibacterium sp. NSLL17]